MPRQARQKSESGIYHVMLRGINQQIIFEDEEDSTKFIETLKTYKAISEYKIFAYCLMSNHVHLLLQVGKEELDIIFKRIAGSYVYWYNWKYYRRGHLFQDRFRSEPINDNAYFLTVLRYIHRNPIKAGNEINNYKFSSYNAYVNGGSEPVDIDFALSLMSKDEFIKFNNKENSDVCLEIDEQEFRLSDADAKEVIQKVSKCKNANEIQQLERKQRDKYLKEIREKGLSIRQISRLTGVSFSVIRKL